MHIFLAAHLSGAAGPAFHFCDWQTALIYTEEQWYLLEHGQLLSVFLLSALAVLSLTPMRIFMKLLISPLVFFFIFLPCLDLIILSIFILQNATNTHLLV